MIYVTTVQAAIEVPVCCHLCHRGRHSFVFTVPGSVSSHQHLLWDPTRIFGYLSESEATLRSSAPVM